MSKNPPTLTCSSLSLFLSSLNFVRVSVYVLNRMNIKAGNLPTSTDVKTPSQQWPSVSRWLQPLQPKPQEGNKSFTLKAALFYYLSLSLSLFCCFCVLLSLLLTSNLSRLSSAEFQQQKVAAAAAKKTAGIFWAFFIAIDRNRRLWMNEMKLKVGLFFFSG